MTNIDLENGTAVISKSITLDGNGFSVSSSVNGGDVINITGPSVMIKNLSISATAAQKTGRCIGLGNQGSSMPDNSTIVIEKCIMTTTQRGITLNAETYRNLTIEMIDSSISMAGISDYDKEVGQTNDYNNSRGISIWSTTDSTLNIRNSIIQGFYYPVNVTNNSTDLTINIEDSETKGRCAVNIRSTNSNISISNSECIGINNYPGPTEGFSLIVGNSDASNNTYVVNDCSFFVYMNDIGSNNDNATEYLFRAYDETSSLTIDKNSNGSGTTYSNTYLDSKGEIKGGICEYLGTIEIYGGTYIGCDDLTTDSGFIPQGYTVVSISGTKYVASADSDSSSDVITTEKNNIAADLGSETNIPVSLPSVSMDINGNSGLEAIVVYAEKKIFENVTDAIASYEITIVCGSTYTADITVDASVPLGHKPLAFYIDDEGNLQSLEVVDYTSSTVTFRTTHTTPFVIMSEPLTETPSTPDVDDEDELPFIPGNNTPSQSTSGSDNTTLVAAAAAVVVIMLAVVALMVTRNN